MSLNSKQQVFVNEYLQCFNRTEAALRAGYSPKTAYSIGAELLKKPEIQEAISERLTETAMSAEEVLMRLAEQARGDINDVLTESGELDIEKARLLKKTGLVKKLTNRRLRRSSDKGESEEIVTIIEMYDAQAALALLGKHHALFTDKTELTGKDGDAIQINARPDLSKLSVDELLALRTLVAKTSNEAADA